MEGVGLLSVSSADDPAWVVVKGISDFAEDTRSEEFERTRELACRNSARFVLSALMRATCQSRNLTGMLAPEEAPVVVARAILGEWLG